MAETSPSNDRLPTGAYVLGGLSFIPLLGVLPGIVSVVWGLVTRKAGGRALATLGGAGIALTVLLYGGLFYFGFVQRGGVYDRLRTQFAQTLLDNLVAQIEMYKVQNGRYPDSLEEVAAGLPKTSMVMIADPSDMWTTKPRNFFYQRVGDDHYYLRGLGPDGEPFTADDIVPDVAGGKLGLLRERQASP